MKKLWILPVGALLVGCAGPPRWQELSFAPPLEEEEAWFLASTCAQACRLPVDERLSSREEGEMVSLWCTHLMTFGKSQRRRLHLRFLDRERDEVGGVRFYVERQKNTSMERALRPEPGDWSGDGQDVKMEFRFRQHMAIRLRSGAWVDPEPAGKEPKKSPFPGR